MRSYVHKLSTDFVSTRTQVQNIKKSYKELSDCTLKDVCITSGFKMQGFKMIYEKC